MKWYEAQHLAAEGLDKEILPPGLTERAFRDRLRPMPVYDPNRPAERDENGRCIDLRCRRTGVAPNKSMKDTRGTAMREPNDIATSVEIQGLRESSYRSRMEEDIRDRVERLEGAVLGLAAILEEHGMYTDDESDRSAREAR